MTTLPLPAPMDPTSTLTALGGLVVICTGVLITFLRGISTVQTTQGERLVRIETTLTGATGDNGLVGEVKQVRGRQHRLMNDMHTVFGKLGLDSMERRTGYDRREDEA